MKKILVTDSLFIKDEHIKKLEDAGLEVERLDKPKATESELIEALKDKDGYILGGVEKVTEKVINSAENLKAIVFTGTGWDGFIPAHNLATQKGIAIGAAPHLNAHAVAEFGFAMTLLMCRDMIALERGGQKKFETTKSLSELSVGIIGLGHIGEEYARMAKGLGVTQLSYFSKSKKLELELELNIEYKEKQEIFITSDVVFVAAPIGAGEKFISKDQINDLKRGAILVSIADPLLFDIEALYLRLEAGEIRGAFDENINDERMQKLPLSSWYTPNESTAFNTSKTIEDVSTSCIQTLINLLTTGEDKYLMNPEYRRNVTI